MSPFSEPFPITRAWLLRMVGQQLSAWAALSVLMVFVMSASALGDMMSLPELAWRFGVLFCAPAALCSVGQSLLYARLRTQLLHGLRGLVVIALCSSAFALAWTSVSLLLHEQVLAGPGADPELVKFMIAVPRALMLGTSSALFLATHFAERLAIEREEALAATALARETQLLLLHSKLNPHFLFNSLNSVVALIDEDARAAKQMVRDVAALLRRSLELGDRALAPLSDELAFTKLYVACEQVRFEERLQVRYDVAPALEPLQVPVMVLHTLVENAIKHGIRAGPKRLDVDVRARRLGDELVLEVTNNGCLATPRDDARDHGIGMANVVERLHRLYGERARVTLTEGDGRVVARVSMPAAGGAS